MKKRLIAAVSLALIIVMLFSACGGTAQTAPAPAQSGTAPAQNTAAPAQSNTEPTQASEPGKDEPQTPAPDTQFPDASKDPVVTLNFGGTNAVTDYCTQAMERAAELAKERSGGTINIIVFPASQLGDVNAMHEAVSAGAQEMYMESCPSGWGNHGAPDASAATIHWFLDKDEFRTVMESGLTDEWKQAYEDATNVHTICTNWYRQPCCILSKKPIRSFDEFSGLKCRSTGAIANACLSGVGANPTTVAYSEVYLSLQQNVIDAAFATLDALYTMGWYEVTDYLLMTNQLYNTQACMINKDVWESMTDAQRAILEQACIDAGEWYVEQTEAQVDGFVQEMAAAGVEIIEFSEQDQAKFKEACLKVAYDLENSGRFTSGTVDKLLAAAGR